MSLQGRLLKELSSHIENEYDFGGTDFPVYTLLEDGEKVVWVSSSFINGFLENIYRVAGKGEPTVYISSSHSDGGVVVAAGGPWKFLGTAKKAFGYAEEGWTDV